MKKIVAVLLISIGIIGCQPEGRKYIEHKELSPLVEWLKKDVIEFKVPIEKENQEFKMSLAFRYVHGYQHKVLKVKVTENSPSGKLTSKEYELKVTDQNGDYIGDPTLSFFDSEHVIETNKLFKEKGTYTYKIEHMMPNDPVNLAMEIGVILDEIK
jgi:gliding motility-associated lipoprotein GldH